MSTPGVLIVGQTRASCGHVERAGGPVQQPEGSEENGRRDQVDGDVLECRPHLFSCAVERHQHEGRHEHDLEPDIEVEEITGQERTGDSHEEDLEQRVVAEGFTPWIDT